MKWKQFLAVVLVALSLTFLGVACEPKAGEGPAERAGAAIDEAIDKADEELEDAAEKTKEVIDDAVDEAKEEIDEKTDEDN